jgi:hypothetical protein
MSTRISTPLPLHLIGNFNVFYQKASDFNRDIKDAMNHEDTDGLQILLKYADTFSKEMIRSYVEQSSFYPALTLAMTKGEFGKVLKALDVLNMDPRFQTPTIRLCHAACLYKLDKKDKCLTVLKQCDEDFNVSDLLDELIKSTRVYEKAAFRKLRDEPLPHLPKA